MKILLVINALSGAGGAERAMTTMANYWIEQGRCVRILSFDDGSQAPFFFLHPGVIHEVLNLKSADRYPVARAAAYLRRNRLIRQWIAHERPDVIISFASRTSLKLLKAGIDPDIPLVISIRNTYAIQRQDRVYRLLQRRFNPKVAALVCQTRRMLSLFPPSLQEKGRVIPNPVFREGLPAEAVPTALPEGKLLLAVGGLDEERVFLKGFDMLIRIFGRLAGRYPGWSLVIAGEGSERQKLQALVHDLNLDQQINLPGNIKGIRSLFLRGDLFVLSSRSEGFPNALCEAMASGLPAVSFDCLSGPAEIIRPGIDGILVPPEDEAGMERALGEIMADNQRRIEMGRRALEIAERFSVERIMKMWDELIHDVLDAGKRGHPAGKHGTTPGGRRR